MKAGSFPGVVSRTSVGPARLFALHELSHFRRRAANRLHTAHDLQTLLDVRVLEPCSDCG